MPYHSPFRRLSSLSVTFDSYKVLNHWILVWNSFMATSLANILCSPAFIPSYLIAWLKKSTLVENMISNAQVHEHTFQGYYVDSCNFPLGNLGMLPRY
jgi:hypothetical protein